MQDENDRFLATLFRGLPENERAIVCGFRGDPGAAPPEAWRPRPWKPGQFFPLDPPDNAYVTVSSFGRAPDRTYRRRQTAFAAGRALLVDDVGTKVSPKIVAALAPTAVIETSPKNFQYWYVLSEPERDAARFDGVIRAFIAGKLAGNDPGMGGVTRVGRLPGFTNGKPQHRGFRTILHELAADRLYTLSALLTAFGLSIDGMKYPRPAPSQGAAKARIEAFFEVEKFLREHGMLKRREPDLSGWTECTCPWKDSHTGAIDNGAAIRLPHLDNQYYGAFRCHHSHGLAKGWPELTEFVNDLAIEELETANADA